MFRLDTPLIGKREVAEILYIKEGGDFIEEKIKLG